MRPTKLSYGELKQEFTQEIQKHDLGVLATSENNYVIARQMMIFSEGLTMSFLTDNTTRKYKQIQANENVALSISNLQIEGIARLKGHPSDAQNAGFMKWYKEKYPQSYDVLGPFCEDPKSDFRVIEVIPRKITAYKPSPDIGICLEILNIAKEKATRAYMGDTNYDQY